jgi:hypothetical protein
MKKSRFTDEQIINFLKQAEGGVPVMKTRKTLQLPIARRLQNKPSVNLSRLANEWAFYVCATTARSTPLLFGGVYLNLPKVSVSCA